MLEAEILMTIRKSQLCYVFATQFAILYEHLHEMRHFSNAAAKQLSAQILPKY